MELSATRVMTGKTLNAGQICLAPDYVFVPEGKRDEFVSKATAAVTRMYPTLKDNPDYTSVINQRHFDRLRGYIDEAKSKGAKVVEINPAKEDLRQQPHHKIAPTLILDPTDDMKVMQDEIFGPVLPVKTYKSVDEAIAYVNAHARPLGPLLLRRRRRGEGKGPDAHDLRRRHRQRHDHACRDGRPAVRRRRPVGHGRLSRHRRLPPIQPPQGDLPAADVELRRETTRQHPRPPYGDGLQKQLVGSIKR